MKLELRSLHVKGCGPLRDVQIEFTDPSGQVRPVTVLGGANGSGKTTVLELIVALAETLHPDYRHTPNILDRTDYAQMDLLMDGQGFSVYSAPTTTNVELPETCLKGILAQIPPSSVVSMEEARERTMGKSQVLWMGCSGQPTNEEIKELISRQGKEILAFPDQESPLKALPLPSVLYFPHYRVLRPVHGEQIHREETRYQWIYRYEAVSSFPGSLDSYLIWLDYAEPEVFQRVCDFLNQLDFDGKTFAVSRKDLKAVVRTKEGQTHLLEHLSSGEQNILIVLLELRRRLLPHSIVLIDEIENSLHPAFQYRIAQGLRRLQEIVPFQLILTTHAPAFVDIFGAESTLILTEF
jgi:predicted ATPase